MMASGIRSIAAATTLGAALVSCGTAERANDRVNAEVPLWFHRPNGAMQVVIHRSLTAASRGVGEDYERGKPTIDAAHARVFIGSSDRGLYALRASDGSALWRYETLGVVQSEPLYDSEMDYVYFGSHDGALYALRASDGHLVWRFSTGQEIARKPVLAGETLFFANGGDQLFAIDRRSGQQRWTARRQSALAMEVAGYSGPAVDSGIVYMAFSDGHVGAYDAADGAEHWPPVDLSAEAEQTAGGETQRYLDVDTTPIVDDVSLGSSGTARVVFVASYAGGVFALDAASGARVWSNEKAVGVSDLTMWRERAHLSRPTDGSPPMPYPAQRMLLASSSTSGLWALDPATGRMIWRQPVPEGGITAPVAVAGALLFGTTRFGLFLMSPRNGRVIDGFDTGSGFAQTPAAEGNRAFIMSNAGELYGIEVEPPKVERSTPFYP